MQQDYVDYDPYGTEESVLHDQAWGFCDPKCFAHKEEILASDLQEVTAPPCREVQVKLAVLSEDQCRNRTWGQSNLKFRAKVDRWGGGGQLQGALCRTQDRDSLRYLQQGGHAVQGRHLQDRGGVGGV